jgi:biotin carboxyl carrier protein
MAAPGILTREVKVPGKIVTAADRMAQIVPKVQGTVTEARKNLGDTVAKGEVMALIESREMAEAVAEYFAARRAEELARTIYNREKGLWHKKITAEQDYMNAKNASQEAAIRLDLARQKLQALGYEGEIDQKANTRFYEVKSPIAGRVIERGLTLGEYVDTTHSAYGSKPPDDSARRFWAGNYHHCLSTSPDLYGRRRQDVRADGNDRHNCAGRSLYNVTDFRAGHGCAVHTWQGRRKGRADTSQGEIRI